MIVLGIDPGGRSTGLAVVDDQARGDASLLSSITVTRPVEKGRLVADVERDYLVDVVTQATDEISTCPGVQLLAVEGVTRPKGRAVGRGGHLIDPSGLIATAQVLGAILGHDWPTQVVVIPPGRNGSSLPPNAYPAQIRGTRAGADQRRHMRSAYDVALQGRAYARTLSLGRTHR